MSVHTGGSDPPNTTDIPLNVVDTELQGHSGSTDPPPQPKENLLQKSLSFFGSNRNRVVPYPAGEDDPEVEAKSPSSSKAVSRSLSATSLFDELRDQRVPKRTWKEAIQLLFSFTVLKFYGIVLLFCFFFAFSFILWGFILSSVGKSAGCEAERNDPTRTCLIAYLCHVLFFYTIYIQWPIWMLFYICGIQALSRRVIIAYPIITLLGWAWYLGTHTLSTFVASLGHYGFYVSMCVIVATEFSKQKNSKRDKWFFFFPLLYPAMGGYLYTSVFAWLYGNFSSSAFRGIFRLAVHPTMTFIGLIGVRAAARQMKLNHPSDIFALVSLVQIFTSMAGRILIAGLSSYFMAITSILLNVWEVLMRLTLVQRDKFLLYLWHKLSPCRSRKKNEVFWERLEDYDMLHLSAEFLLQEMIIEDACIVAAPIIMWMFDWYETEVTIGEVIYKTLLPLGFEILSDLICILVDLRHIPILEAWQSHSDIKYFIFHLIFFLSVGNYCFSTFGGKLAPVLPISVPMDLPLFPWTWSDY